MMIYRRELDNRVKCFWKRQSRDGVPILGAARKSLQSQIQTWNEDAQRVLELEPIVLEDEFDFEEDLDDVDLPQHGPELVSLGLPSTLGGHAFSDQQVVHHAISELKLRVGHAFDLLSSIRMSVRKKAALIQEKDRHARGTKDNLRSQETIRTAHTHMIFLADCYNTNFEKIQRLSASIPTMGREGEDNLPPSALRLINTRKDLQLPSLKAPRNQGDSKHIHSWIYHVSGPNSESDEAKQNWERESACPMYTSLTCSQP